MQCSAAYHFPSFKAKEGATFGRFQSFWMFGFLSRKPTHWRRTQCSQCVPRRQVLDPWILPFSLLLTLRCSLGLTLLLQSASPSFY